MAGSCRCLKESLNLLRIERVCNERVTGKGKLAWTNRCRDQGDTTPYLSTGSGGPNGANVDRRFGAFLLLAGQQL